MRLSQHKQPARALLAALAIAAGLVALLPNVQAAEPRYGVVDLHVDLSYQVNYEGKTLAHGTGQFVAKQALAAHVETAVLPLYIPNDVSPTGPRLRDLDDSYKRMRREIQKVGALALPGERSSGAVGTVFAFEGAAPLAGRPQLVAQWLQRGLTLFGLVHSYDNALAGSAGKGPGVRRNAPGLSRDGKELVTEVFRQGGLVDVSHASDAATREVIQMAKRARVPVVASHSGVRALVPHARNLSDELLRGIAETGGVVGVNFHSRFLRDGGGRADIADVVRQIRYLVRAIGIDHVALGSDFEGDIRAPNGLRDARGFPKLAKALRAEGLAPQQIAQIFGLNARRVLCLSAGRRRATFGHRLESGAVDLLRQCWASD